MRRVIVETAQNRVEGYLIQFIKCEKIRAIVELEDGSIITPLLSIIKYKYPTEGE